MTAARTRRTRTLQLGTALATSLFAGFLGTPAFGQTLPVVNDAGGATITVNPTDLQVDLGDANRVINFDSYNVGAANTVNYLTTNTSSQYAVLNRVTVLAPGNNSVIDGAVTGQPNIVVWLSNPNGILVGPTGSFNTGGLMLTTMDTDPTAFLASGGGAQGGAFTLSGGSGSIAIGGTLTTTAGSGLVGTLLLAAPQITVTGSATATGAAELVAATDASFAAGIGSPLSVTITKGSTVAGALIDVSDSGGTGTPAITGSSVALVGASDTTVISSLLNVDAGANLSATGTNGAIVLATRDTGTVAFTDGTDPTTNGDGIVVNGALTTHTSASDGGAITIGAAGAATIAGGVTADTDYTVGADTVTIGSSAGAVTQSAGQNLSIDSTSAPIALVGDVVFTAPFGSLTGGVAGNAHDLTLNFFSNSVLFGTSFTGIKNLTTDGGGITTLNGAITTSGAQTYNDAVVLGDDVVLDAGGAVSFAQTVDSDATARALAVNTTAATTFTAAVGTGTALASLTTDAGGGTAIDGGSVVTTGAQTYGDQVTLGADATLTGASGSLTAGVVGGGKDLTLNFGGIFAIDGATFTGLDDLTSGGGGGTQLTGTLTTTGAQVFNDPVRLTGATVLNAGAGKAVTFAGALNGAQTLAVNTTATTTFGGAVGATAALTSLTTDAGGGTSINGGAVKTTGAQNYGDTVTLGNDATLTGGSGSFAGVVGGGKDLTLNLGGTTALDGSFGGIRNLATGGGGTISLSGTITTTGTQNFGDAVTLAGDATLAGTAVTFGATVAGAQALTVNSAGATTFSGTVGSGTALTSLTTDATGTTVINGGSVTTTGAQTYGDPVTLGADTTLTGGSASFAGVTGADHDLTLNLGGVTTLDGSFVGIGNLATGGGGTTSLGGTITTTGMQTYEATTLVADATLTGTAVSFTSTLDGGQALAVNASGSTAFLGAVGATNALASLATDADGETDLNGGTVTTTGAQTYNDAVVLSADTTINAGAVAFAATVNSQNATARALSVNTSGAATFGGAVGTGFALSSLTTDAGGSTALSGGAVTTNGAQSFGDAVTLGADTTLTGTTGSFAAGLTGNNFDLTLNYSGTSAIGATVTGIRNLVTGNGGTTQLAGTIATGGSQTYGDAVVLTGNTTLSGTALTFDGALDGAFDLAANSGGATTFGAAVGATTALASLTTDAAGATALNGGSVRTSGGQSYNDPVTLGADTTLTSTGSGAIALGGAVSGAQALTIDTGGTTSLGGAVNVASLTTDATGGTSIGGGAVITSGAQSYGDTVSLGTNTTLTGATGSFAAILGSGSDLTLAFSGATTIAGALTGVAALTTNAGGTTQFSGGTIATTGAQTFNDQVVLGANTSFGGPSGAFNTGLAGNAFDLTLSYSAASSLTGAFSAIDDLVIDGGGATALSGSISTIGGQTYFDAITLAGATTLSSSNSGDIAFESTLDGGQALTVNSGGTTRFQDAVGQTAALASLTTDAGGTTAINGGSIATSGAQSFGDQVSLGSASTTLSGATGSFAAGLIGNGGDLTLAYSGTSAIDGGFTGIAELATDSVGTTQLAGTITTSGSQNYGDAVVLTGATTLASSGNAALTLASTVDGAFALTANTTGATTFGGAVGSLTPLASLATNAGGGTAIDGGSVTTTGAQAYGDLVTLGADTTLTGGSGSFAGVDGAGFDLTLSLGGTTALDGTFVNIDDLVSNGGGVTTLSGAITTTGTQTYSDAVVLAGSTTLTAGAGEAISFASTVDSTDQTQALTVATDGLTTFADLVGSTSALLSLSTGGGGVTAVDGGGVVTVGTQTYADDVTIGANDLFSAGGAIAFQGKLDGPLLAIIDSRDTVTLGDAVGGTTALGRIAVTGDNGIAIDGGTVNTVGDQTYNNAVTLGANTLAASSASGTIGFASTIDGAFTLGVDTAGATTFGGAAGGATALTSLTTDAGGTTALNGGSVVTTGAQSFGDAVTLGAATALASTGGAGITFGATVDGAQALTVNTVGATTFGGIVGGATALTSLTTDTGGGTAINGGAVTTSGAQSYGDAVTLGANTVLTGGSGSFAAGLTGNGFDLTLNFGGSTALDGSFTGIRNLATGDGGATTLSGTISTAGAQTYNDAVTLLGATTLASSGAGMAGDVTFANTLDGAQTLMVNTAGTTAFNAAVGGTGALTSLTTDAGGTTAINGGVVATTGAQVYGDAVTLGAATTLTSTAGGNLTFASTLDGAQTLALDTGGTTTLGGAVGANAALAALATDAPGSTAIDGGAVTTTGAQTFNDAVTLGAATTLTSTGGGAITLGSTVDGAQSLAIDTAGLTALLGAVGSGTALASLTTDAAGTTDLNGATVTTIGAQTYNDAVVLSADTTLAAGGAVSFAQTLDSDATARALTVNTAAATTFGGAVGGGAALASLTTDAAGTIAIDGGAVTTTGAQSFGDAVTLGAAATLTSTGGAAITFGSTVDGAQALTVATTGATTFTGAVGAGAALATLTTDAGGSTAIDGGGVTTTGAQIYNDAVTLGTATTLASSGNGAIGFATTLDGAHALALNTGGATTFGGIVGGVTALASLTTDAGGATAIDGGAVITTGAQTYGDAVTLGAATTLTSTASGQVTFATTLDGAQTLALDTSGTTTFGGAVGGTTALTSLTTDAGGVTAINGGAVATTGAQTYNDAVTLGAATTLTSTGGGALTFATTLDGAQDLVVGTAGNTRFGGIVGGIAALASLTTDAAGATALDGGAVTTTGAQTYGDAVTLGAATTLASTGAGNIGVAATLNGARTLAINTSGTTTFGGAVGGGAALTSLTTDLGGTTAIDGGAITTTGAQTFNDAVTLGAATTLTSTGGGALSFTTSLDGAQTLALNSTGTTTFSGVVGGTAALSSLTTDAGGTTAIDGGAITTTGAQTFNDAVTLGADATLTAGGDVIFATTVDSLTATARSLAINTAAATTLGGAVGATNRLGALITDAPGSTAINGGAVRTTGAQTYNDAVALGADTLLSGFGGVTAASTVNGAFALTAQSGGSDTTLGGVVGGATPLASLAIDSMRAFVSDATVTGATTIFGATGVRIGTLRSGSIQLDALSGDITGLAGSSVASDPGFGRADLTANAGGIAISTGGLVQLGTVSASGAISAQAGVLPTSAGGSIDIAAVTSGTSLNLTARAPSSPIDAAHDGDIIVGAAGAGTTATLANSAGASGDVIVTGKLTAGGDIALASADDVLIAAYNPAADSGLIRSTTGDVAIDARGSVFGIGGAENTLPTAQRGGAALSTTGNLTINSDGDARFDSLTAGGSLALNIAGSLTGSPLSGGAATGANVPGGAIFAAGAGGDVTIRSGLAGTALLDVVTLDRIVADRNITISADQLAVGTLATNSGTITLNDTSGAALTADNYYVGLLSGSGDLNVVLTGQPTVANPLVALDAAGASERFDASFGKTDLTAATSISGTVGGAAQLSDIAFGTALNLGAAALVADTLTSINGGATIGVGTGTLSVLAATLGGPLGLTKSGGAATTPGDELRLRSASVTGTATLASSTHQRIGSLSVGAGAIGLTATNDVTGLAGPSTGTSDTAFGRANLAASGNLGVTAGGLVQLGAATSGSALTVAAGNAASDGSIDAATVSATGALSLVATANAPVGDGGHDGDILLGSASAGATALISNVSAGGDSGNIVSGAIVVGGDTRIDAANDLTLTIVGSGASLGLRARRDASTGALSAAEDIGVSAGRNATLGALDARDDVLVTGAGAVTVASVDARGTGPDTRTVSFASPSAIAFPAETSAGSDIAIRSTGANVQANGALTAASDVTIDAATGAAIRQNVTAGGNYAVTGGTGVTLGDASARTQAAGGTVTIIATTGDVTQGAGRLTVVGNGDGNGAEPLTISANGGNIVLANSQLTGGGIAGRESDVVLSASSAITADDLDGDRVGVAAGGNIVADTIEAGTGAADLGDLAQRQSIDLVSTGGSVAVNTAQAFGAGHDIDIRAANGLTATALSAGGTIVGRAGTAIAIGAASAGEDVALQSNTATIAISGAATAGDDVLLVAPGAITTGGAVIATGAGPDARMVTFGAGALDAAYAAESNAGGDVVVTSTGANVIASGPITAASDVIVSASTSAALLGTTAATAGNIAVTAGNSARLVGDVTSGIDTTVTAGTTATIEQNLTARGAYTVTGATGVTLGDAAARTQQAGRAVTITATTGDVAQGAGLLTVVSNSDLTGTEPLTIAANAGSVVLANSQLTGGSISARESDVALSASGAITADDIDGDRVTLAAGGNIVADTIEAGTGAADLRDLAQRQSVDLVSTGGSVSVNTAQAFGAGHDIDIRAAGGLIANGLAAGGSLIGRAGNGISIGAVSAGEDVALKSNTATIAITGATVAGDDVLLTAPGAITTGGALTASGTGPDVRTVTFGAGALDAAYAAETNAGGDIVVVSTGASYTASGSLSAASDVAVTASSTAALLGSTTATVGNIGVTSGASALLVGNVTSGANTTIAAGATATIRQNLTAGGNYAVTGATGVMLGDASARTQQANGNATVTATGGDIAKDAGRLTIVANADRTTANNAEALILTAATGNIALANSQLTGGSTAGRESDVRLTARSIVVGKVDGASLTARATTAFAANEAIVAGNAARGADPLAGASTVDVAVTAGPLSFTDIAATNAGHDVVLNASGAISGANITAARSAIVNGGSLGVTGATTAVAASVTIGGGTSATLGSLAAGTSAAVSAGAIAVGPVTTGATLNLNATDSTLSLGSAVSGGDVMLAAATRATLGPVTATGRNVTLSATDADINGAVAATQISVIDRASGANPLRLGDGAAGNGGFALNQAEINRLNGAAVILDAGTSAGAKQDVAIGALAIDADTGATALRVLGQQRIDLTGALSASATTARTLRIGGAAADGTRATTLRIAATTDSGARILVPGIDLDLRADRIGAGLDATFLATLGLTPGAAPATPDSVARNFVANSSSTLYDTNFFGAGTYTAQTLVTARSLTVRYADYALFQNTGGTARNAGVDLASLGSPSSPALFLQGPNPPNAGGFALFGTINGVPDSAAAVLGDNVLTLVAVDRISARVNGCLIGSGSGCIASTTAQPPLPPLNAFRGDIFSTQGDFSIPFDPVVGTNNESLFGDIGSFGLSDLPLMPIECDPDKEGDCAAQPQDAKPEEKAP